MSHRLQQLSEVRKCLSRRLFLWRVLVYIQLIVSAITSSVLIRGISQERAGVLGMMSLFVTAIVGSTHPMQRERVILSRWKQSIELELRIARDKDSDDASIDNEIHQLLASMFPR
jgi:hypothetical protein